MIICLYHGSSFKNVNTEQTGALSTYIAQEFANEKVVEAYYSSHVLQIMKRRGTPLLSLEEAILENYDQEQITILITNMMNGVEYQNILKTVMHLDVDHKVKMTNYLLNSDNLVNIAQAITESERQVLFIGHGNDNCNRDYQSLNELTKLKHNYVATLKSDLAQIMNLIDQNQPVVIKPLMLTSAYHAKRDIEQVLMPQLIAEDYTVEVDLTPLVENEKVRKLFIEQLHEIM